MILKKLEYLLFELNLWQRHLKNHTENLYNCHKFRKWYLNLKISLNKFFLNINKKLS